MPDLLPGMVRRSALVLWHVGRKPIQLDRLVPLLRPQDHGTEIIVEEQFYYGRCGEQLQSYNSEWSGCVPML